VLIRKAERDESNNGGQYHSHESIFTAIC
jgi:hypothetical protein